MKSRSTLPLVPVLCQEIAGLVIEHKILAKFPKSSPLQKQHELPEDEKPAKTALKSLHLEPYLPNWEVMNGMPVSTAALLHTLKSENKERNQ